MSRRRFPLWLVLLVVVAVLAILVLQLGEPLGDAGLQNALSMALGGLTLGVLLLWFLLASGAPRGLRAAVFLALAGGTAWFLSIWRLQGFSGALIPHFVRRDAHVDLAVAPEAPPRALDLTPGPRDFPGFLGAARDGRVPDVRLERDWQAHPPVRLWRHPVGAGWSGFAAAGGVAVTLEERPAGECLCAYDIASGTPLWTTTWPGAFDHVLGGPGPRSTPTLAAGRVVALGVHGLLVCCDGRDGTVLWQHDLLAEWGVDAAREEQAVQYGRSNSPLVVDGNVVVPVGGVPEGEQEGGRMAGLAAFALADGALVWEGPPRQVSFASPTLCTLAGRRQLVIVNEASVSGHDPARGTLLWEHPWPGVTSAAASVSQAQSLPPDGLLLSKGYGQGAERLRLTSAGDGALRVESVWTNRRALRTKFTNAVVHGEHAYGLSDGILECVRLEDGERVWRAGRYGHGQILLVGDLLLVLSEEGELSLVDPRPDAPDDVLATVPALEGKTWNQLALADDVLLLRNGEEATAFRLTLREAPEEDAPR